MAATPPRLFVFGLGYSAGAFARAAVAAGMTVAGTTRDAARAARLQAAGIDAVPFEGAAAAAALARATHVIASAAPEGAGDDPVLVRFAEALHATPDLRWLGYLSTVGVYGNYGGAWVSERTSPHPATDRARRRIAAERAWTKLARQRAVPLSVLRLAGIYGPGRNALVNLAEGKAHRAVKRGQVFNRIHVADLVEATRAAVLASADGIFNLADDEPAPPQDVVAFAAGLMGVPPPPEIPLAAANLSPMARSFYEDNKRVMNDRLKDVLGVRLAYPTYREGLSALWREGAWRG
jgi:nucleoside-diphosphate-sugar epimerase